MLTLYYALCKTDSEFDISNLISNYSRSVKDVYSSLVQFIIVTTKRLDILSLC
jgi:hypothetical protein